jgi:Zn-dependent protease with chaperone function
MVTWCGPGWLHNGREQGWDSLDKVDPSPESGKDDAPIEDSHFACTLRSLARQHGVDIDLRVRSDPAGGKPALKPFATTWTATPSRFLGRPATGSALVVVTASMASAGRRYQEFSAAHELGHAIRRCDLLDVFRMTVLVASSILVCAGALLIVAHGRLPLLVGGLALIALPVGLLWQSRRISRWWDHRSEFLADDFAANQKKVLDGDIAQTIKEIEPVSADPPRWKQIMSGRPVKSDHPTAEDRLDRARRRGSAHTAQPCANPSRSRSSTHNPTMQSSEQVRQ